MHVVFVILTLIFTSCAVAVVARIASHRWDRWHMAISEVGHTLDVSGTPGTRFRQGSLQGLVGASHLELRTGVRDVERAGPPVTRLRVYAGLPEELYLEVEGRRPSRDVRVGIEAFDARFCLHGGGDAALLARLGHRSRAAIAAAVGRHGVRVRGGKIEWTQSGVCHDPARLLAVARAALELAEALSEHDGATEEALLHHAFHDPHPRFRRAALAALIEHVGSSPAAGEALDRAPTDPDVGIRYLAARQRGEAGLETIRQLLREGLPEDLRGDAAALLGPGWGGGLTLVDDAPDGSLSLEQGQEGALSAARRAAEKPRSR